MAYSFGTATGLADLLDKFKTFCEGQSYATDSYITEGTGKRWHAHHSHGTYVNFRAYINETPNTSAFYNYSNGLYGLAFNVGTGYSAATAWHAQPGVPVGTSSRYPTAGIAKIVGAIPNYHFFASNGGANILAVIEFSAGNYQWFGWGNLNKIGAWTGERYFLGSRMGTASDVAFVNNYLSGIGFFSCNDSYLTYSNSFVDVAVDGETGWHYGENNYSGYNQTTRRVCDNFRQFQSQLDNVPNVSTGRTPHMPVRVEVYRDTSSSYSQSTRNDIGIMPDVVYISMKAFTPGQQITLGSANYRVFPFFAKGASRDYSYSSPINSGYYGFAVKE